MSLNPVKLRYVLLILLLFTEKCSKKLSTDPVMSGQFLITISVSFLNNLSSYF